MKVCIEEEDEDENKELLKDDSSEISISMISWYLILHWLVLMFFGELMNLCSMLLLLLKYCIIVTKATKDY